MLTEVKRQFKVTCLSMKYGLIRELLNKTTFLTNVIFMILNNATFILQWVILFSIKEDFGGYNLKMVLLLWGIAASTYGCSHFMFARAYNLSNLITTGKLDAYLVQPKSVLLSAITSDVKSSALGDLIYGYIMLFIYGFSITRFLLFTLFSVCGGLVLTGAAVIFASLSFWFQKSEMIAHTGNNLMVNFSNYPDSIFKGITKIILYTIIPVGIINYIPVRVISNFNIWLTLLVVFVTIFIVLLSFLIFNCGLKRYSSSNLMGSRI